MSYDLLIFEPDSTTDEDFPRWWEQVVAQWDEPGDFSTIDGSTPAIRAFYRDLIRSFPPFNGPDALSEEELEEREEQGQGAAGRRLHHWRRLHLHQCRLVGRERARQDRRPDGLDAAARGRLRQRGQLDLPAVAARGLALSLEPSTPPPPHSH